MSQLLRPLSRPLPDSSPVSVVVEHSVVVVPDDVLGRPPHDLPDEALQRDGAAALVELFVHGAVALVDYVDLRC